MNNKNNFLLFIWLVCSGTFVFIKLSHSEEPVRRTQSKKFICNNLNKKYVQNFTCWVKLINRTHETINFDGYLQPKIQLKSLRAHIKTFYRFNVIYRQVLITADDDICAMFSGKQVSFLDPKLYFIERDKLENIQKGCPYSESIYMHGLVLDTYVLGGILPAGDWKMNLEFYTKNKGGQEESVFTAQLFLVSKYEGPQSYLL